MIFLYHRTIFVHNLISLWIVLERILRIWSWIVENYPVTRMMFWCSVLKHLFRRWKRFANVWSHFIHWPERLPVRFCSPCRTRAEVYVTWVIMVGKHMWDDRGSRSCQHPPQNSRGKNCRLPTKSANSDFKLGYGNATVSGAVFFSFSGIFILWGVVEECFRTKCGPACHKV